MSERGMRFRSMCRSFQANGVNVWDARIAARKFTNYWEFNKGGRRTPRDHSSLMRYSHLHWPTTEDFVEVDFWSIVIDLRAVISGTLIPRSWSELSSTWIEGEDRNGTFKMRRPYIPDEVKEKIRAEREKEKERSKQRRVKQGAIRRIMEALIANGELPEVALVKATDAMRSFKETH